MLVVSVYYNDNMLAMLQGYKPTDAVKFMGFSAYEHKSAMSAMEDTYAGWQDEQVPDHMRSMCTGDVVHVSVGDVWFACAMQGWVCIDKPVMQQ